jgi:hypothetical protein
MPGAIYVRVTHRVGCSPDARCVGAWPERTADGLLAWLDADTLVFYESRTFPQVAVPVAQITQLEVCRGHEACARAVMNNAPGGLLMGIMLGATVGAFYEFGSALTWAEAEVGKAAAVGAAYGAGIGAAAEGGTTGNGLWQEVTVEQLLQELAGVSVPAGAR